MRRDRYLLRPREYYRSELARVGGYRRQGLRFRRKIEHRGQFDAESAAAIETVLARDLAAVFLEDAVTNAKPQPGAFADGLGGVKGIEDALGLADTGPIVGKFHSNVGLFACGADGEHARAGIFHGVHGVADDVIYHLEQLVGVAANGGQYRRTLELDTNISAPKIQSAELNGAGQNGIQVEQLFLGWDPPRKAGKIGDQIPGPASLFADFFSQAAGTFAGGGFFDEQVGVT